MNKESNKIIHGSKFQGQTLLDDLRLILQIHDQKIFGGTNSIESYTAEAGRLKLRLRNANSSSDVEVILQELFSMPGCDLTRLSAFTSETAEAIWKANLLTKDGLEQKTTPGKTFSANTYHDDWAAARERERALIPSDAAIPRQGDCYQCSSTTKAKMMIVFSNAGSASQESELLAGTSVKILELFEDRPIVIPFIPIDADSYAAKHIAKEDYSSPHYSHFYLMVPTVGFLKDFEPCT
jgi:hypothetical protein